MKDFRDNEKKTIKNDHHFGFYFCEICHGLSLCVSLHFVLYAWSSYFALFLSYYIYRRAHIRTFKDDIISRLTASRGSKIAHFQ